MSPHSSLAETRPRPSPDRLRFLQRIAQLPIKPAAHDYYVRWAESWIKAKGHHSSERTQAYFDTLGRSAHLADWQFRQAVDAARILACEVLQIAWASAFNWRGLSDQARSLEPDHRTLARESIPVRASSRSVGILPTSLPSETDPEAELTKLIDALRRAIRLKNLAVATEETYVHWNSRFIRFCYQKLGQSPHAAGPTAISDYLEFIALERNVAPATQKQALNAMVFLQASSRWRDSARASLQIPTLICHVPRCLSTHQRELPGSSLHRPHSRP